MLSTCHIKSLLFLFAVITLCGCNHSPAFRQEYNKIDFSSFFVLKTPVFDTQKKIWYRPHITVRSDNNNEDARFVQHNRLRFEYILHNYINTIWVSIGPVEQYCNDSVKLNRVFGMRLNESLSFRNYFALLSNAPGIAKDARPVYTKKEMMQVASRFFMYDRVNQKDTSLGAHICVGINGQRSLLKTRDLAALEAFCFEALGYNLRRLLPAFEAYGKSASYEAKKHFTGFSSYLEAVKQSVFLSMENDEQLEKTLVQYYKRNQNSLGFSIQH